MDKQQNTVQNKPPIDAWQWPADLPPMVNEPDQAEKDGDCAALLLAGKEKHEAAKAVQR